MDDQVTNSVSGPVAALLSQSQGCCVIPQWRVLIWPGATEIGLELREALGPCKEVELYCAGSREAAHSSFAYRRVFEVPPVASGAWLERLKEIIEQERITHIMPAHDDTVVALASHAKQLSAKIITSPEETCLIARSKSKTYEVLRGYVPVPKIFEKVEDISEYPVFLKPDRGQGSQGIARAGSAEEVRSLLREQPGRIVVEYLPGEEFTVDCFSDRQRGLMYAKPRTRKRVRSGISMESQAVDLPEVYQLAERIAAKLTFYGAWFFQVKRSKTGELKLLEVATRIAGTSAVARMDGVNLPLLSLYEAERRAFSIEPLHLDVRLSRALRNSFQINISYSALYVDLDDTLIVRNEVNLDLIQVIYQGISRKIRIVLITRHKGDLVDTLKKWRISHLFDEIIHLKNGESKAAHINVLPAVLIDDSFRERSGAFNKKNIIAISPDMVDILLEDRY